VGARDKSRGTEVSGENVFLLPPLEVPDDGPISAERALQSPAVQLFMERARAGGFPRQLNDIDAPLVANICRRLDGIALAIEIAASRVGFYGIRGTAELLETGGALRLPGSRSSSQINSRVLRSSGYARQRFHNIYYAILPPGLKNN
jgi:predicted ATPase